MSEYTPIVTVPARNEEEHLPAFFASLAAQTWHEGRKQPLPVVIVLNNCTDGSRDAVEKAIAAHSNLAIQLIDVQYEADKAHVGTARRLAMDTALGRASNVSRTAILTTDADSTPLPDWVSANLRHLSNGIDLVCGIIWLNKAEHEQLDPKFTRRTKIDQDYNDAVGHLTSLLNPVPHNPWPYHNDHSGQSLAIKAEIYRAVGGLPPLSCGEDYALVQSVREAGYLVRHPMDVVVETSARLVGRAAGGMADSLRNWMNETDNDPLLLVEHPKLTLSRLKAGSAAAAEIDSRERIPAEEALVILNRMIAEAEDVQHAA